MPAESESGARSSTGWLGGGGTLRACPGSSIPASLKEGHPRRGRDFDQPRGRGGEGGGERTGDFVAVLRPVRLDAIALGDAGDVELRQVEPRRRVHLLD